MKETILRIGEKFKKADSIWLTSHIRPDGDAIGSLLALGLALQNHGKQVTMLLSDGLPANFRYLPGSNKVVKKADPGSAIRVAVDCSDIRRLGKSVNENDQLDISIDHHITNVMPADLNLVEPEEPATSAILAKYMPEWGMQITADIATCLLTGILSDTLGFRTSNMTPNTLRLGAMLMEKGANLPDLYQRALVRRSFDAARYWGFGLSRLQCEDRLLWTSLTASDRNEAGYPGRDDADLMAVLSAIDGADVAVIFIEQPDGKVKISWRAQPGFDVSKLAVSLGGGGHPAAAGAELGGTMEEVQSIVMAATHLLIQNSNGTTRKKEEPSA
ncbi:MAG: DHH family phosphoesterase [Anaerolineaceae bacterium]|nr:DHH family phosphoesterase [Anaerolineaceae bacterium]MBN2677973.1 DHH family phosphoesterase [Anaerolineaceae bacterium]